MVSYTVVKLDMDHAENNLESFIKYIIQGTVFEDYFVTVTNEALLAADDEEDYVTADFDDITEIFHVALTTMELNDSKNELAKYRFSQDHIKLLMIFKKVHMQYQFETDTLFGFYNMSRLVSPLMVEDPDAVEAFLENYDKAATLYDRPGNEKLYK